MSKKSMGLAGAADYGAGMRAAAEAAMPEIACMAKGGAVKVSRETSPKSGFAKGGAVRATGQPRHFAVGGVAKIRHNQATKSGAPMGPKGKR